MPTSGIKRFSALYRKEMRGILPEIITVSGLIIILTILFYISPGDYPRLILIPLLMLAGLAAILPFVDSGKLLSGEWNSNTIYLTMSLPVRGGMILGSKLLALISQYLIYSVVLTAAFIILVFPQLDLDQIQQISGWRNYVEHGLPVLLLSYLISLAGLGYAISLSFFSQLAGKLVSRFSGFVTVLVFIIMFWLGNRLMSTVQVALWPFDLQSGEWFMSIRWNDYVSAMNSITYSLGISLSILSGALVLVFLLAVLLYNRRIEL